MKLSGEVATRWRFKRGRSSAEACVQAASRCLYINYFARTAPLNPTSHVLLVKSRQNTKSPPSRPSSLGGATPLAATTTAWFNDNKAKEDKALALVS